jgi:alcohol dehydrogenase class IV
MEENMAHSTNYRYLSPSSRIFAGRALSNNLVSEVRRIGAKRVMILSSHSVAETSSLVSDVQELLSDSYVGSYTNARKESPRKLVEEGVEFTKSLNPDLIVVIGGGSAVVTCRAITILLGEGVNLDDIYTKHFPDSPPDVSRLTKPKIPNFLVLTTPTNGADRGGAAIYDDTPPHRKEIFDPKTRPSTIFLDRDALLTAPFELYRDTATTTVAGTISALLNTELSPFSSTDYRQSLELCLENLPKLNNNPEDGDARLQLAAAALLANRAAQASYNSNIQGENTGLGRQIRYKYPHIGQGLASITNVLTELKINQKINSSIIANVGKIIGLSQGSTNDFDFAGETISYLTDFISGIGLPTRLRDMSVDKNDFEEIANLDITEPAFGQGAGRVKDLNRMLEILEMAW